MARFAPVLFLALVAAASARIEMPAPTDEVVQDEYIVVYRTDATTAARQAHASRMAVAMGNSTDEKVTFAYDMPTFKGYAAKLWARNLDMLLSEDHVVDHVERNQVVRASEIDMEAAISKAEPTCEIEDEATWGLVRLNEERLNINGEYHYLSETGLGVTAYIVDTGIYTEHSEFQGRAVWGFDATGEGDFDGNGHGTHVAGTVMSKSYGVAKDATASAVKVLTSSGSGSNAGVIAGVEFTCSDHTKRNAAKKSASTANMSLGGGFSSALNKAVAAAIACGIPFAVAAGNEDADACFSSPASEQVAVCVGSSDNKDYRSDFSNHGKCVDIFAPGSAITSTWIGGRNSINTISGTSMASPHVCGVMAKILSFSPEATPSDVTNYLLKTATTNTLQDVKTGSPNTLLYSNCQA